MNNTTLFFRFYGYTSKEATYVLRKTYEALSIVEEFFDYSFDKLAVTGCKDHKHYCTVLKEKRPLWGVTRQKKGNIYFSNPYLWDKRVGGHSLNDFKSSIIHELVQVYYYKHGIVSPAWIVLGIGTYLGVYSSQQRRKKEKRLQTLLQKHKVPNIFVYKRNFYKHPMPLLCYLISFKYHEFLIVKAGQKQHMRFIHKLTKHAGNEEIVYKRNFSLDKETLWRKFLLYLNIDYQTEQN